MTTNFRKTLDDLAGLRNRTPNNRDYQALDQAVRLLTAFSYGRIHMMELWELETFRLVSNKMDEELARRKAGYLERQAEIDALGRAAVTKGIE